MPDAVRTTCTRCKQSIYNCMIDGVRVPIFHRLNIGKPEDSGPAIALNDPGVKMTSYTRSMLQTPVARIELCEKCFAEVFGLPLVTADEDPMWDGEQVEAQEALNKIMDDPETDRAEKFHMIHTRALHGFPVGWGEAHIGDLAAEFRKPPTKAAMIKKEI